MIHFLVIWNQIFEEFSRYYEVSFYLNLFWKDLVEEKCVIVICVI
jgi:hypothetical protein